MKKTIAALWLTGALLPFAGAHSAAADPARQSASGSARVHLGLPVREFTFSAMRSEDGTAQGQAQLENRDSGFRGHIEIDCLNVLGNIAVMSGVLTHSNSPNLPVGTEELFAVQDNGEGPDAPADEITLVFSDLGITCTDITDAALLDPFLVTIENGQIQVRP